MAAYSRVYDSRHLQADCQEPGSAPEPYRLMTSRTTSIVPRTHSAHYSGIPAIPYHALVPIPHRGILKVSIPILI